MLLVHSNIKVINKLVRVSGWLTYARLSPRFKVNQVAQFARNIKVCPHFLGWLTLRRLVAHFTPDWWLSMVQIIHLVNRLPLFRINAI
jgi:hypothetical protein